MNKDRAEGAAKDTGGKLKEALGKATGDKQTENRGKADQAAGKVQKGVGDIKDALRDKK